MSEGLWFARRPAMAVALTAVLLTACGGEADESADSIVTATPAEVVLPTRDEVAAVAYGTATCMDDKSCALVTGVRDSGIGILEIETSMFRDADAEIPGLSLCIAVANELWDDFVMVLGSDGGPIAQGRRGEIPICEVVM